MKTIINSLISVVILLSSCYTYQVYIPVETLTFVPDGTQAIILTSDLETVKKAFIDKGIMVRSLEGGFETEEILLDEGTRAMYKAHTFDGQIRVTAFWGITQKVKSQMYTVTNIISPGSQASSAYDVHAWDQVRYAKDELRPKKVFDYAIQIMEYSELRYKFR